MKNEATGLTERETARRAYDIARGFVRNFDSSFENLFLYGDTGVGKTFLSHCIAHDLLESAHCVMYFSAFDLFELLADSKFSRDKTEGQEFVFDSDLLIIDDLGTELTNSFVSSQLFLCINERIMRQEVYDHINKSETGKISRILIPNEPFRESPATTVW